MSKKLTKTKNYIIRFSPNDIVAKELDEVQNMEERKLELVESYTNRMELQKKDVDQDQLDKIEENVVGKGEEEKNILTMLLRGYLSVNKSVEVVYELMCSIAAVKDCKESIIVSGEVITRVNDSLKKMNGDDPRLARLFVFRELIEQLNDPEEYKEPDIKPEGDQTNG